MTGWKRSDWFDETGLPWRDPSPNIRNLNEAILYPGLAMLESATNYSVGRGTDIPFEHVGADWIHGAELADRMERLQIPGVRFSATQFKPESSNFSGKTIEGVRIDVTDRNAVNASRLGRNGSRFNARSLLYPHKLNLEVNRPLIGNGGVVRALAGRENPELAAEAGLEDFLRLRQKYLIYP